MGGKKYGSILVDLFPMYLGKLLRKKVMVYAPSVEPFSSNIVRSLTKLTFNKVDVISVREEYSLQTLNNLKLNKPVHLTADPAFLVGNESRETGLRLLEEAGVPKGTGLRIGITIRNGNLAPDPTGKKTAFQRYVGAHVSMIEKILVETDAIVVLFTTSISNIFTPYDDDRIISLKIRDNLSEPSKQRVHVLTKDYTPEQTKAMIGTMDAFVATRTHSGIFALSTGVPLLAIAYEYKTPGIMKMIGLQDRVLDINRITEEELISSVRALLKEREKVAQTIKKRLPVVQREAARNADFVVDLLNDTENPLLSLRELE